MAARAVDVLAADHLADVSGSGRLSQHHLLRCYAAERAQVEDPPNERTAAMLRLCHWRLGRGGGVGLHELPLPA